MRSSFRVIEKSICGINNPQLVLKIKTDVNNIKLKVLVDSKEKNFELFQLDKNLILLNVKLEKEDKKVEVYANGLDKEQLIISLKNMLVIRIFNKIFGSVKKCLFRIKAVFIILLKGSRFLWREHHFLVPPSLWKKYFNDFICRVCDYNSKVYNPFIIKEYNKWLKMNNEKENYKELKYNPKFSIFLFII